MSQSALFLSTSFPGVSDERYWYGAPPMVLRLSWCLFWYCTLCTFLNTEWINRRTNLNIQYISNFPGWLASKAFRGKMAEGDCTVLGTRLNQSAFRVSFLFFHCFRRLIIFVLLFQVIALIRWYPLIVKFSSPGRWDLSTLMDEPLNMSPPQEVDFILYK